MILDELPAPGYRAVVTLRSRRLSAPRHRQMEESPTSSTSGRLSPWALLALNGAPVWRILARLVSEAGMLDQAQRILKDVFGYDAFRGNQGAIIQRVANGDDALVLMPTTPAL